MTSDIFGREEIDQFFGAYQFLSNFHPVQFVHDGRLWSTSEHAYQAAKCANRDDFEKFLNPRLTAGQAKRLGRQVVMRANWDQVKIAVMRDILRSKFKTPECRKLLLATGDAILTEGNTWGDTFWGVCDGKGLNVLGRLLEQIRNEIRLESVRLPEDFLTHQASWREALLSAGVWCDVDDREYWEHELEAFDRAYAELKAQL